MAKLLDQQRYKCALAAMQTVHGISGALPILHSGPGCADKLAGGIGGSAGGRDIITPDISLYKYQ